jgi:ribosomal protein S18 acetylase RimI-like enzyme
MGPSTWTIRDARTEDIPGVLSLWSSAGVKRGVSDSHEGLSGLLAAAPHGLLIAESGQEIVGSVIAAWDGWRGSFYRLAVSPDRRREGIATALLREGEQRLAALGALRLTAIVADDEPLALEFWRALGYEQQPHRMRFLRHLGRLDAP